MIKHEEEAEVLKRLLKKKSADEFSSSELSRKAYWRWDRSEFLEAAVLFDAAASRCEVEMRQTPQARDNTFNNRIRAGVMFRLAGEVERAWPILQEAATFDWQAARIEEDSGFTEWAFVEMLIVFAEKDDRLGFSALFWEGVTRCDQLGFEFPSVRPKQDVLLDLCEQLRLLPELRHVVERIKAERKLSPKMIARLKRLEALTARSAGEHNA